MWLGVLAVCGLGNVDIAKNGKRRVEKERRDEWEAGKRKLYRKLASQTWRREGNELVLGVLCH
jgi:hypothetical protein